MERDVKRMRPTTAAAAAAAAPIDNVINLVSDSESDEETQLEILDHFPGSASSSTSPAPPPSSSTSTTPNITGMKENLKCNICLEVFCDPITLVPCAHVFCGGCFSEWAHKSCATASSSHHRGPSCPSCRKPTTMVMDAAKNLTSIVDEFFMAFPEEKRSKEDINELKRKDTIPRGKPLSSSSIPEPLRYSFSRQQVSNVPSLMYAVPRFEPSPQHTYEYPPYANPMPYHPFSLSERYQFASSSSSRRPIAAAAEAASSPPPAQQQQPIITSSLIQRFVQLTGCTRQEANAYLTLAFQQHSSFEHAVQRYLDSTERY